LTLADVVYRRRGFSNRRLYCSIWAWPKKTTKKWTSHEKDPTFLYLTQIARPHLQTWGAANIYEQVLQANLSCFHALSTPMLSDRYGSHHDDPARSATTWKINRSKLSLLDQSPSSSFISSYILSLQGQTTQGLASSHAPNQNAYGAARECAASLR